MKAYIKKIVLLLVLLLDYELYAKILYRISINDIEMSFNQKEIFYIYLIINLLCIVCIVYQFILYIKKRYYRHKHFFEYVIESKIKLYYWNFRVLIITNIAHIMILVIEILGIEFL
jgi:hypothetical protein